MLNGATVIGPGRGASPEVRLVVGGPLTQRNHEEAVRLAAPVDGRLASLAASRCHGSHHFGRPMMALTVKKSLGPVRHALSQMVVAGVMVVSPPIQVRVPDGAGIRGGGEPNGDSQGGSPTPAGVQP